MTLAATAVEPRGKPLSLWLATALVIGNMVGSGAFLLPASLGSFLLAVVLSKLAHRQPDACGPYAYSRRAFGDFIGFQTAWGYWLAAWIGNAAIATAFVGYLSYFWTDLGG